MHHPDLTLQKAKDDQVNVKVLINKLNKDCNPQNPEKRKEKDDTLRPAEKLSFIREEIIRAFEKGIFPYIDRFKVEKESNEESDEDSNEKSTLENEEIGTTDDIPDSESEESAAERRNQRGQGLKILTPNQMFSKLSISLAQLKA